MAKKAKASKTTTGTTQVKKLRSQYHGWIDRKAKSISKRAWRESADDHYAVPEDIAASYVEDEVRKFVTKGNNAMIVLQVAPRWNHLRWSGYDEELGPSLGSVVQTVATLVAIRDLMEMVNDYLSHEDDED